MPIASFISVRQSLPTRLAESLIFRGSILLSLLPLLSSCFTGIESTDKIKLSKADIRAIEHSADDTLMDPIRPSDLGEWNPGKQFVVTDPRITITFLNSSDCSDELPAGSILRFSKVCPFVMPDGKTYARLDFKNSEGHICSINSGKTMEEAEGGISSGNIPMLVDADMVENADRLLRGKTIWNKTPSAYSADGIHTKILRFSGLRIDSVTPGRGFFPLKVWTTMNSAPLFFYMDFNSSSSESRSFPRIFTSEDPRVKYHNVPDDHWEAIRKGTVVNGMTKDECRLSLGNPSDVNAGRDYNSTIDLWQYDDGTFLRFSDGLLVSFRL